jgi:hypothetical protein
MNSAKSFIAITVEYSAVAEIVINRPIVASFVQNRTFRTGPDARRLQHKFFSPADSPMPNLKSTMIEKVIENNHSSE